MSWKTYLFLPLFILLSRQILLYLQDPSSAVIKVQTRLKNVDENNDKNKRKVTTGKFNPNEIVIAAVACGGIERIDELSVMMKSAILMLAKHNLNKDKSMKFLIFTDNLARETEKLLNEWKHKTNQNLTWDIRPPLYPH